MFAEFFVTLHPEIVNYSFLINKFKRKMEKKYQAPVMRSVEVKPILMTVTSCQSNVGLGFNSCGSDCSDCGGDRPRSRGIGSFDDED